jgi:hypothetical protein
MSLIGVEGFPSSSNLVPLLQLSFFSGDVFYSEQSKYIDGRAKLSSEMAGGYVV